jgi:hypothetical protein
MVTTQTLKTAAAWARDGILTALKKGFIPKNLQDNYSNVIPRQEFCWMALMFIEFALGKDIDEILTERGLVRDSNAFSDTSDPYILAAFALGVTNGTQAPTETQPGIFTPNGKFTRQEAATMLMRVCEAIGMNIANPAASGFADLNVAGSWARNGIDFARAEEIMLGTSVTPPMFSPGGTFTRQESILTFNRFGPASEIAKIINNRDVVSKAFFTHINSDSKLVAMLNRYNELRNILYDIYLYKGVNTVTWVAVDDFSEDADFSGEWNTPPYYPFTPEQVADAGSRIARCSLYRDFAKRFYDDPVLYPLLKKEGGGSAGMWPQFWSPMYGGAPGEMTSEELAIWGENVAKQLEEFFVLVEDILTRLAV